MHRALALAETVRGQHQPQSGGRRGHPRRRRRSWSAKAPPHPPAARTPRSSRSQPPAPRARGGTAVVTLEPCAHTGRTGPCADALVAAGVAQGRLRRRRPEPGRRRRRRRLRAAGVEVVGGVEEHAAASGALRPWLHAVRTGRPFVTWKFAATLDGRVAAADCTSRWISSAASRADVHRLRAEVDAIMVGSGTVLADDPQLTVRDGDALAERQPLRVVLDRRHRRAPTGRAGARRRGRDAWCWTPRRRSSR